MRRWPSLLGAFIAAAFGAGACAATPYSNRDPALLHPAEGVQLVGTSLRLALNIDVSSRPDIFSHIARFDVGRSDAELDDGRFASWDYVSGATPAGVITAVGIGTVRTGDTLASVGSQSPFLIQPDGPTALPRGVECDLIEAQRLRVPRAPYEYIATCKMDAASDATKVMLFDADGRHEVLGVHPLHIMKFSTAPGLHGMSGTIGIITGLAADERQYLQTYSWFIQ